MSVAYLVQLMDSALRNACSLRVNRSDKTAWRGDAMLDSIRGVLPFIQVNVSFILSEVK
jgi:hypothetical protein